MTLGVGRATPFLERETPSGIRGSAARSVARADLPEGGLEVHRRAGLGRIALPHLGRDRLAALRGVLRLGLAHALELELAPPGVPAARRRRRRRLDLLRREGVPGLAGS